MRTSPLMTLARAVLVAAAFVAGSALAQDPIEVGLTNGSGLPGEAVAITFSFSGNGETSGFGGDFVISNPGAFSNVDLSGCLSGNTSAVGTCVHPGGNPSRVRILLANDAVTPLADFSGTIEFTIDPGADPGGINLAWDNDAWDTAEPEAEVVGADGSVEVLGVQVDPLEVSLSNESGNPGDSVPVTFTFTGNDATSGFGGDFVIAEPAAFASVDLSGCLSGNTSAVGTCVHPGGDESRVRILIANDKITPLADFAGTITFTIDNAAGAGVIDLAWDDTSWDTAAPEADVNGTDGSVTVVLGPQPAIGIAPASHDFGILQPGASDTATFTVTNTGDGDGLTISSTGIIGDTEFSLGADTCDGATLAAGANCSIEVQFAPAGEGDFTGTLEVDSNAGVATAALSGSATVSPGFGSNPPGPVISLGTTEPGFGLSLGVQITNTGTEDLSVDCGPLNDPDGVFSIVPDPVVFQGIPPGESATFTVSCQLPEPGSFSGTMSCTTNDPANATVDYEFVCIGAPLVIPTMNGWGMLLLILVLLAVAAWRIRAGIGAS